MIAQNRPMPYAVYLLHFDRPIGRYSHYLGICQRERLHWRMLEHLRGKGAKITARAAERGIGWTIAATWEAEDHTAERKLKTNSHLRRHCAICQGDPRQMAFQLEQLHYEPKKEATPVPVTAWPDNREATPKRS